MKPWIALLLLAPAVLADLAGEVGRAFRAEEPSQRLALLGEAEKRIDSADEKERNRAAAAVEKGLKTEFSPDVRAAALEFLLDLRTERAMDRAVAAAVDPDEKVRARLRALVIGRADGRLQEAILRALREDESWRMRCAMVELLLAAGRAGCAEALRGTLADPHPAVAAAAAEALERLTGGACGLDAEAWSRYLAAWKERKPPAPGETRTTAEATAPGERYAGPIRGVVPTLYTIPIRAKINVFVVDMSSSMRQGVRSSHLAELKRALMGLPGDSAFNVLCFDQRMFFLTEAKSLLPATAEGKAELERFLGTLPSGDKTDVRRSVASGLAMIREALERDPKARADLFLLTDGVETVQSMNDSHVEAQFMRLPAGRCHVHLVALGQSVTSTLRSLVDRSGGSYVQPPAR